MLIVQALSLVLLHVLLLVDSLESVHEETIILLKDGVLGGKFERISTVKSISKASSSKGLNTLVSVEHTKVDSTVNVGNLLHSWFAAIIRGERDLDSSWFVNSIILATILISEGVSSNDDWRGPSWNASWDVGDNNWLSENSSIKDVSNGSIWTSPHLFQVEFLNSTLIWGDGGALDCNLVLLGGLSSINSDLIVGLISAGDGQVIVLGVDIYVWVNVLRK